MANSLSRIDALKMSALGFGAATFVANGIMVMDVPMEKDIKWDEEKDVVIIGSGFAGLAAGIKAS